MSQAVRGILAMAAASAIWGLSGIFYKALSHVPALEVLCHRTLWSAVFFGLVLAVQGRRREAAGMLAERRTLRPLAAAAVTIAINWFIFIFAVQSGQALEASLGYYIFPLFAVALGLLLLGEKLNRWQAFAVGLAVLAVVILAVGLGAPPWIALALATSFSAYGLIKKRLDAGPVISVFLETLILSPLALLWLGALHSGFAGGAGGWFMRDWLTTLLFVLAGPITAGPLVLMSYAARRISFGTLGLIQYLNPTLQFGVAVFLFGEAWTAWHGVAFALIWTGLAIYSWTGLRQEMGARKRSETDGTLS